jgi:pimeloyl-ACP methyl ester carboxylesterase
MPSVTIPAGTLHYRTIGPVETSAPPVVFVHGFLVNSRLWDGVAERLATAGIRSYLVDWPLGAHRTPMADGVDMSPADIARMINDVLDALGLADVTLAGNDTGGAICQLLLAEDPSRIGRVVLTNCDAFENFPPRMFVPLFEAAKRPRLTAALLAPMRLRALRHSPMAFGLLMRRPRDAELTRHWITPALTDRRIRADIARFARNVDRTALVTAAPRLADFPGPVRVVWGTADRCFTLATARRLSAAFSDGQLIEVPGVSTFVSVDAPAAVADAIVGVSGDQSAGHRSSPGLTSGVPSMNTVIRPAGTSRSTTQSSAVDATHTAGSVRQ